MSNYSTMIPLIGGMTVGNRKATGSDPKFMVSWPAFHNNDSHIVDYLKDVPYHVLPSEGEDLLTPSIRDSWYEKLDFVSSVCPCAGLSMLNNATNSATSRGSDAAQNEWIYKSAGWVLENLRPAVYWGENAPGLFSSVGSGVRTKLQVIAEANGYSLSIVKTDTYLHGIPQHRLRTFYFFWRDGNAPLLEWKTKSQGDTDLADYLKEIPVSAAYQDEFFTRNYPVTSWKLYEYVLEKTGLTDLEFRKQYLGALYHYISSKGWIDDAAKWMDERYPDYKGEERTKLEHIKRKLADDKGFWDSSPFFVDKYVNAIIGKNMHTIVHPTENRFLNVRECMWLMGLPHDFNLVGAGRKTWNHIAQNVPTNTAAYYTSQVMKYVKGELKDSGSRFLMQDNISQRVLAQAVSSKFKTHPII